MAATVSVIIPCYGQAVFLSEAVESVAAQTFTDWEIIVASGCEACAVEARLYSVPCIRVLEGLDRGVADARNEAIDAAEGRLILPLDADDRIAPTFLEKAVAAVDAVRAPAIASANLREFGAGRGAWRLPPYSQAGLLESNGLCASSLYHKELWRAAGGYDVSLLGYEDWNFWIACSKLGPRVVLLPEPLFHYRIHSGNTLSWARRHDALLRAMIRVRHPDLYGTETISGDLDLIARMPEDAVAALDRRLLAFPDNTALRFFRELVSKWRSGASA